MTVTELNNMTDEEFDNFMNGVKAENPNLLQYIADFYKWICDIAGS